MKLPGPPALNVPSVDVCGASTSTGKQGQTGGSVGSHRYSSPAGEKFVVEREREMSSGRVWEESVQELGRAASSRCKKALGSRW